jgi:hypothetical protein
VDAHGGALTTGGRYLWVADRFGNRLVVVETARDTVVNEISLSGSVSSDPLRISSTPRRRATGSSCRCAAHAHSPQMCPTRIMPSAALPVSVVRVDPDGRRGVLVGVAPITHIVHGVERADPHGLKVRWP